MTHLGHIKTYDRENGVGMISPDTGGDALPFTKADLRWKNREPKVDQRYCFETRDTVGRNRRAVDLRIPDGSQIRMESITGRSA